MIILFIPLLLLTTFSLNAEVVTFQETDVKSSEAVATVDIEIIGANSAIFDISIPAAHLLPKDVAGTEYKILSVRGFSHLHKIGKPLIPAYNYLLAVAPGTSPEFTILYKDPVVLDNYLLHQYVNLVLKSLNYLILRLKLLVNHF